MVPIRVYADARVQEAILDAAEGFEARLAEAHARYLAAITEHRLIPTERRIEQEMFA